MAERMIEANGVELCTESFGDPADPPVLLVMGLGALRNEAGQAPDEPYEVIASLEPGADPVPYHEAGATWWLTGPECEGISVDEVRGVIREGPGDAGHGSDDEEAIR